MLVEELDLAIQSLLEEQPNQEKPKRRRRNKEKDIKKQLLRGKLPYYHSVLTTVNEEIHQSGGVSKVHYVDLTVTPITKGKYLGWSELGYGGINFLAQSLGLLTTQLYLEPFNRYNYATGIFEVTEWHIYQKGYEISINFLDEDYKRVYVKGWNGFNEGRYILTDCSLTTGIYPINEVEDTLERLFNKPIKQNKVYLRTYREVEGYIQAQDSHKFGGYINLARQYFDQSKWYKKLMQPVNSKLRSKDDLNRLASMYNHTGNIHEFEGEPKYDELITKVTAPRKEQDPQDYYY